jgi:hypothetical protein
MAILMSTITIGHECYNLTTQFIVIFQKHLPFRESVLVILWIVYTSKMKQILKWHNTHWKNRKCLSEAFYNYFYGVCLSKNKQVRLFFLNTAIRHVHLKHNCLAHRQITMKILQTIILLNCFVWLLSTL